MPAEKTFPLQITADFKPIWNQFEESVPDLKKSDFIRRLIFQYLHLSSPGVKNIIEGSWDGIKTALKTYNKYSEGTLKLNKRYRDYYVTSWNEFYSPVYTLEEVKEICKEKGYWLNPRGGIIPRTGYHDIRERPPKEVGKPFKFFGGAPVRPPHGKSKPDIYLVVERRKNDSFHLLEDMYNRLKKGKEKTIANLISQHQEMVSFFEEIGLFDWSPLMNIHVDYDHEIVAEYGVSLDSHWDKTPLGIEKYLILKPWHLKNKKNLRKLKQDKRIKYTHSIAIQFDESKNNEIIEIIPGHWFSKVEDGEEQPNQVIEVED